MHSWKQFSEPQIKTCRICLEEDDAAMVRPCHCNGSIRWVHVKCVEAWISKQSAKVHQKDGSHWIECELCKSNIECQTKPMECKDVCHQNWKIIVLTVLCTIVVVLQVSAGIYLVVWSVLMKRSHISIVFVGSCVVLLTLFILKILYDACLCRKMTKYTIKEPVNSQQLQRPPSNSDNASNDRNKDEIVEISIFYRGLR